MLRSFTIIILPTLSLTSSVFANDRPLLGVQRWNMYSWNEHSEGGGLCPTMGSSPEYEPDTRWLDEVGKALSGWKNDRIFTEVP